MQPRAVVVDLAEVPAPSWRTLSTGAEVGKGGELRSGGRCPGFRRDGGGRGMGGGAISGCVAWRGVLVLSMLWLAVVRPPLSTGGDRAIAEKAFKAPLSVAISVRRCDHWWWRSQWKLVRRSRRIYDCRLGTAALGVETAARRASGQLAQGADMLRDRWEFEHTASKLAEAAETKKGHHRRARMDWWLTKSREVMGKIRDRGLSIQESVAADSSRSTTPPAVAARRESRLMLRCNET